MNSYHFSFPTTETTLRICDFILGSLIDTAKASDSDKHRFKVIVSELVMNAYNHGNKADPEKYIDISIEMDEPELEVVVKDQGQGVARETFKAFVDSYSDPEDEHGRGIKLVCTFSDKVNLFRDGSGRFCVRARMTLGKQDFFKEKAEKIKV